MIILYIDEINLSLCCDFAYFCKFLLNGNLSAFEEIRKTALTLVSPPYISEIIQNVLNQIKIGVILNINMA